jgi:hypothetical protein
MTNRRAGNGNCKGNGNSKDNGKDGGNPSFTMRL